jgi:hypothetical protein
LQWNLNGSSQYFTVNLGVAKLAPFTIVAIGTCTNVTAGGAIATFADIGLAQSSFGLRINAGTVGAYAYSTAGAFNESTHPVAAVNNQTYVFGAVYAGDALRTVYLNGTPGTPNTTSGAVTSASQFSIGVLNRSGITQFWPGGISAVFIIPRALTDAEMALMRTPADVYVAMYIPLSRTLWVPVTGVTIYRPGTDITVTGWTGTPDNVNLYTNIDEASASDADYVTSPNIDGSQGPFIDGLTASVPVGTWDVKYRSDYNSGTAKQVRMTLLDSSNVSVGAGTWQTVTTSFVLYTSTITTTGVATRFKIEVQ